MDAIHTSCIHKLHISGSSGCNLDPNKIFLYSLNTNITTVFSIVSYYNFVSIAHKIDQFYQIDNKIQNFEYNSCMDMILSIIDSLCNISCHKLRTNGSDGCELNKKLIIQYTFDDCVAAMITILKYDQLGTQMYKMDPFWQVDDVIHYLNLITTIIKVIDSIAHQIEILIATYAIICKASLFIFTHGTCVLVFKFMINDSLYLTTNNMDNLQVIICIINSIIAIILQIAHMDIILIRVVVPKVMVIYQLDSSSIKVNIFTRNNNNAIIVIHYNKFTIKLYHMNCFYVVITVTIINKIDTIIKYIFCIDCIFTIVQRISLLPMDIIYSILQILCVGCLMKVYLIINWIPLIRPITLEIESLYNIVKDNDALCDVTQATANFLCTCALL